MKKILTVVLLLTALCGIAFPQNASDFVLDAYGGITKYVGFDTDVVIPATIGGKKIKYIDKEAFRKADLTSVTIPVGVTYIGESAFSQNKLTSVTISNSVAYIDKWAFYDNKLIDITIPNSVTYIGESAFRDNKLNSVTIPGSVKTVEGEAFFNNTTLANIIIAEGVIMIGDNAFGNTKCTSVSLPSTIMNIDSAFDASGKPSFTLAANINSEFPSYPMFYSYIANDRKSGTYAFFDLESTKNQADDYEYYETQYGAVFIRYTGDLTRVRIPAEIGGIAVKTLHGTFYDKKIDAVQIPESVTYIGGKTFSRNKLVGVTIPNSVKYLSGFSYNQLASVTIPNSVTCIGKSAFAFNQLTSVTIPNSVTCIGDHAFAGGNQLTSVIIPNKVTYIGNSAFSITYLARVTIPNSVVYIGKNAFSVIHGVQVSFTIGSNVKFSVHNIDMMLGQFYDENGKVAGTYTGSMGRNDWTRQQ